MRAFEFSRCALSISTAALLLSACSGSSIPVHATGNAATGAGALAKHKTFDFTGTRQRFIVPSGVTQLTISARGAAGGGRVVSGGPSSAYPGLPGRVYAVIPVHPGDKLYVFVGGWPGYSGQTGGFNGGAVGGGGGVGGRYKGKGGGGASDVRMGGDRLKDRIIVAAGGGGAGSCYIYCYAQGGDGGGLAGKPGGTYGGAVGGGAGGGGTQSAGGSGGPGGLGSHSSQNGLPGANGALGRGGAGGNGGPGYNSEYLVSGTPGGGGGGGYYGGGGGGGSGGNYSEYLESQGGGGGGGSSYVEPSAITSRMWTGWRTKGDGRVTFSWN